MNALSAPENGMCVGTLVLLTATLAECFGELRSLTVPEHVDLRFIVVAVVRRGGSVLVQAFFMGLYVGRSTPIRILVRILPGTFRIVWIILMVPLLAIRLLSLPRWLLCLKVLDIRLLCAKSIIAAHTLETRFRLSHFFLLRNL